MNLIQCNKDQLQQQVEMFWKTDFGDSLVNNKKSMSIDEEKAASVINIDSNQPPIERALGVQWNVESDEFSIKVTKHKKPFTRRGVLSIVSSVYDPLGFMAPVVLTAKKMLQDLCKKGIGWDNELGENELRHWEHWYSNLQELANISVARCMVLGEAKYLEFF